MPFQHTYFPLMPGAIAGVTRVTAWPAARSYHAVCALMYCLGPVAMFLMAWGMSRKPGYSFGAALAYSLVSPAALLLPLARADLGGAWYPRRLHLLAYWGESRHRRTGPVAPGAAVRAFLAAIPETGLVRGGRAADGRGGVDQLLWGGRSGAGSRLPGVHAEPRVILEGPGARRGDRPGVVRLDLPMASAVGAPLDLDQLPDLGRRLPIHLALPGGARRRGDSAGPAVALGAALADAGALAVLPVLRGPGEQHSDAGGVRAFERDAAAASLSTGDGNGAMFGRYVRDPAADGPPAPQGPGGGSAALVAAGAAPDHRLSAFRPEDDSTRGCLADVRVSDGKVVR